jgi:cobalt-zinc-cadmium efflux system membrane fusion protein
MKFFRLPLLSLAALFAAPPPLPAAEAPRRENTVVLNAMGVTNLRIETVVAAPADFEETAFALGRIEARPDRVATVSSRIPGRVVALHAFPGDHIAAGAEVARIESRQPGNPAPVIALTAPRGGLVTQLAVRLGDPVEPDRALLTLTDLSEVYAIARVPEHVAGRLVPGARAHIVVAAMPAARFAGELLRFGTEADTASGTLDAVFRLSNPDGVLRPGLRAEFSLVLSRRSGVVSLPRSAIQGELAQRFVYVRDRELPHAFVKTPVVLGQGNDRVVEIVSGLPPAAEVVTRGAYALGFAGAGSVSLQAALDAAHGHAHAADGSELKEKARPPAAAGGQAHDHDHDHGHDHGDDHDDDHAAHGEDAFWKIMSGVLLLLLLVVGFFRRPAASASAPAPAEPSNPAR